MSANAQRATMDGNTAVAHVAYRTTEVCAIFPITPSSTMAELADEWAAHGQTNIWGGVPVVQEMQSEGGAAGAVHGALQTGAMTTTFTASQGLMLMLPNMYKIAGELTPTVFHVAARALATQALSIFGDHTDVMAARGTGFALLSSGSVQEAHDLALVAQAATLASRVPFLHFFDGFRTSHEVNTFFLLEEAQIRAMVDDALVRAHRARALDPERPFVRGTAHNPDTFFQARETANPFIAAVPGHVQAAMDRLAALTGRQYHLFDYDGPEDAERVIVLMGSGAETARETAAALRARGERVGVLQVHLFRPFDVGAFVAALPAAVRGVAVLEQTKEPGAAGEPLYQDVVATLAQAVARGTRAAMPRVVGGRYGLSSKDFPPGLVKAVFDELAKPEPRNGFTLGINDDVMHTHLDADPAFKLDKPGLVEAVFYGLGADGTVGANKNSVKIIAEDAGLHAQGYFVYDSHKSGAQTVSHLRFGPDPIRMPYLIRAASFVACHQFSFVERTDVLRLAAPGATFLLNSPYGPEEVWDRLPRSMQHRIIDLGLRVFVIDASRVAQEVGLRGRTNTILQTCFFAISGVLPKDEAIRQIKKAIEKTYARKGADVVRRNFQAVDDTLARLHALRVPAFPSSSWERQPLVPDSAPDFVRRVTARMMEGLGDEIPVSLMPVDGTFPSGTAAWEKRNIADFVPVWEPSICIQCGQCSFVCPHGVIRAKYYDESRLEGAPRSFRSAPINVRGFPEVRFTLQIHVEDCTGCGLCTEACPAYSALTPETKAINLRDKLPLLEPERDNVRVFRGAADQRPRAGEFRRGARGAVPGAAVRLFRRLRRLRRNALSEAAEPTFRRPYAGGQCHGVQLDLWRQFAGDAVDGERRGAGAGVVELAVRGQCRVWPGVSSGRRQAPGNGGAAGAASGAANRRGAGHRGAARAANPRVGNPRPARHGGRAGAAAAGAGRCRCAAIAVGGGLLCPPQRVDRRRRWLGL